MTVKIDARDLEVLASAAQHWADELIGWIIPASEQFEDEESAEEQTEEHEAITGAVGRAEKALKEVRHAQD